MSIMLQIVGHMFRQEDMPGIPAIHDTLREVYSCSGDICFVINIGDLVDGATVNSHPYLNLWRLFERFANFERTSHRFFRAAKKKQRHPITGRDADKSSVFLCLLKTFRGSHDSIKLVDYFNLIVDEQLRITNHVD